MDTSTITPVAYLIGLIFPMILFTGVIMLIQYFIFKKAIENGIYKAMTRLRHDEQGQQQNAANNDFIEV